MALPSPTAPFTSWRKQYVDPAYGYAWYCEDAIVVSQLAYPHASAAAARNFQDYQDKVLSQHAAKVAGHRGLLIIHDWRLLESYDGEARPIVQERMRKRPRGSLRGSIICVRKLSPLVRMAAQAANLVSTLSQGATIELSTDLEAVLAKHHVRPALVQG